MIGGEELHALWLVFRREYVQRVTSTSFLVSTLVAPLLFIAIAATPALLEAPRLLRPKHIVLVCDNAQLARQVQDSFRRWPIGRYRAGTVARATPAERQRLDAMVRAARIDGFLWLDDGSIRDGRVEYVSRAGLDSFERDDLSGAIGWALIRARLAGRGLQPGAIKDALRPVDVESIALEGAVSFKRPGGAATALVVTVMIITLLEMSLLSYGVVVMRSVLEDKTSRVVEILLCSVTPRALMAGKILGIGAVSLTQVAMWAAMAAGAAAAGAHLFGVGLFQGANLGVTALALFALLYLLGYLLYSSIYAALGAAFNSADEAQYWNFILTLPLLFSGMAAWALFEHPDSAAAMILSLAPPSAPVIMSMRVAASTVPLWQVGAALALMAASIYAAMVFSARIYRVGILMYGKKPTLREIARWLHYA
ncbi:MAG TPA: ABC transporter permease [Candidatus Binataceae bacterium]|nr:ABC transporter permease [Candidatus Binataceae bacterium]